MVRVVLLEGRGAEPNKALHWTAAAFLVSRGALSIPRPRPVSLVRSASVAGYGLRETACEFSKGRPVSVVVGEGPAEGAEPPLGLGWWSVGRRASGVRGRRGSEGGSAEPVAAPDRGRLLCFARHYVALAAAAGELSSFGRMGQSG